MNQITVKRSTAEKRARSRKGADDEGAGDGGEGALEDDEGQLGDDHALGEGGGHGIRRHALEEELVQGTEEGVALVEGGRVAVTTHSTVTSERW